MDALQSTRYNARVPVDDLQCTRYNARELRYSARAAMHALFHCSYSGSLPTRKNVFGVQDAYQLSGPRKCIWTLTYLDAYQL